ncbi:MAG: MerR family transcriptional regulator [Clostridiales bacterium]|nr:MerR family transcriptional regulator [Clostridiales bacterium]
MKRIAIIGDYNQNEESHRLIKESISDVAKELKAEIDAQWIGSDELDVSEELLGQFDGFWFSPGSPYKDAENVLSAIEYARENGVPALGTCAGFQHMVIEFSRNVLGLEAANSEENDPACSDAVIAKLACTLMNKKESLRISGSDSILNRAIGGNELLGEYRCNYGFNEEYHSLFQNSDAIAAVVESKNGDFRGFEMKKHPFFVGTLFIPQLDFRGDSSYRIIKEFVKTVLTKEEKKEMALLKIGELASLAGVSSKALRLYESKDIIKPVKVDPETGYRFYSADQCEIVEALVALQDMGFSLNEIKMLLQGSASKEELQVLFAKKRQALQETIWKVQAQIEEIDSLEGSLLGKKDGPSEKVDMEDPMTEESSLSKPFLEMSDEERAWYLAKMVRVNPNNVRQILSEAIWL